MYFFILKFNSLTRFKNLFLLGSKVKYYEKIYGEKFPIYTVSPALPIHVHSSDHFISHLVFHSRVSCMQLMWKFYTPPFFNRKGLHLAFCFVLFAFFSLSNLGDISLSKHREHSYSLLLLPGIPLYGGSRNYLISYGGIHTISHLH